MRTPFRVLSYRTAGLAAVVVLSSMIIDVAARQLDWTMYAIAAAVRDVPSWVALPVVIFIAASVSSTVGFAFSAIAAAMISTSCRTMSKPCRS